MSSVLGCVHPTQPCFEAERHLHRRGQVENCISMKAVTKCGIAAVRSLVFRTRWIADSSGDCCPARLASILARKSSPGISTCNILIIAIATPVETQSQCGP